jgi:polysaccharide biosynthesis protein PslH
MRLGERHRLALVHLRGSREESVDKALQERCDLVEAVTLPDPSDPSRPWRRVARLAHCLITGRPIQVAEFSSRDYAERLRGIAERWRPDVIQIELEAMAQYLPLLEHSPGRRVLVLDEPAVQTADEVWRTTSGLERIVRLLDRRAWRRFERRIAGRADAVVVLTESDGEAAIDVAAGSPIYTIPLKADLPPAPLDAIGASPPSVIFVGGFGHPPNVDAARRLALRIFPCVRERSPESLLYLVGDKPPPDVRALARDGIVVTGGVPEVESYLNRAAVVAAPLRVGGGMRLKVLEALGAGKALVATPRAVEGLAIRDGEHALVADSDAAFADALLRLLDDQDERRRLGASARSWAERHLDPALAVDAYERLYDEVLSEPERRRCRVR